MKFKTREEINRMSLVEIEDYMLELDLLVADARICQLLLHHRKVKLLDANRTLETFESM